MFFMDPHTTDPDRELLPERPGREELRKIVLELATDLADGAEFGRLFALYLPLLH